jgi:endo-1,4-beta-xylanase
MPVDALGIQGHIGTHQGAGKDIAGSASTPDFQQWEDFLRQVEALGYGMLVTEFDVNDRLVEGDIATRDAAVAEAARRYMDITLACTRISEFLCWGLDDRHSWLQKTRGRADGLPLRPTPYDDQFRPKPLRDAMAAAFRTAPSRKATLS